MRYNIKSNGQNILIKSENAALSHKHKSSSVVKWIRSQQTVCKSLDYGCGKMRYSTILREISEETCIVDSKLQISRQQVVYGQKTSIEQFVSKRWNDVSVVSLEEFPDQTEKYDLIICCNVLSAIPCKRQVNRTLKILNDTIAKNGRCLFINQHRNSYFNKSRNKRDSIPHAYGWIQKGTRGYSYYGIIDSSTLLKILPKAGFQITKLWIDGQATLAECVAAR